MCNNSFGEFENYDIEMYIFKHCCPVKIFNYEKILRFSAGWRIRSE